MPNWIKLFGAAAIVAASFFGTLWITDRMGLWPPGCPAGETVAFTGPFSKYGAVGYSFEAPTLNKLQRARRADTIPLRDLRGIRRHSAPPTWSFRRSAAPAAAGSTTGLHPLSSRLQTTPIRIQMAAVISRFGRDKVVPRHDRRRRRRCLPRMYFVSDTVADQADFRNRMSTYPIRATAA